MKENIYCGKCCEYYDMPIEITGVWEIAECPDCGCHYRMPIIWELCYDPEGQIKGMENGLRGEDD